MALIKKNELKQMDAKSLNNKLEDLRKELMKINAQVAVGTAPQNSGGIKEIKRTIARIIQLQKNMQGGKIKA